MSEKTPPREKGYMFIREWVAGFTLFMLFLTALSTGEHTTDASIRERMLCHDIASVWTYHPEGLDEMIREWNTGSAITIEDAVLENAPEKGETELFVCQGVRKTEWGDEEIRITIQGK